jgi:DNA polymerase-3 subunit gamma/tau
VATDDVLAVLGVADAELILAAADAIAAEDGRGALEATERLARSGRDVSQFGRDLLAHLRQLLVLRTAGELPEAFSVTAADPERLRSQSEALSELALVRAIDVVAKALADIKEGDDPRMTLELAILRAARPQVDPSRQALLQRLEDLERRLHAGEPVAGGSPGFTAEMAPAGDPPGVATEMSGPAASDISAGSPAESPADTAADTPDEGSPAAPTDEARASTAVEERVELERVVGLWPAVLDQVREAGSELLSTVFAAARPVAVDAEQAVLKVGFPASAAFNKRKAEAQEARERLEDAVRVIVGERLRPVYVLLEGGDAEDENPSLSEDELIQRFKAEFDAEEFEEVEEAR